MYEAILVLTFPTDDEDAARSTLDKIQEWLDARSDVVADIPDFNRREDGAT